MHYSIVANVCPMNFFYVFIVPGPILRHLDEFGKIRLLLGENTRFLSEGRSLWVSKYGLMTDFQFFFNFVCNLIISNFSIEPWSTKMRISGDIRYYN